MEEKIFKSILCPTDFTSFSEVALKKAAGLASMFGAELSIAHIITDPFSKMYGDPGNKRISLNEVVQIVEERIKKFLEEHASGVQCDILVKNQEHPYKGIIECVEEKDVDLIVMATRGITGPRRIFLGSVADSVARRAPCSVLVVRTAGEE